MMQTIDQLATISDVEQLWQELVDSANIDEIMQGGEGKMERLQIIRGNQRIEIIRVWRNDQPAIAPVEQVKTLAARW